MSEKELEERLMITKEQFLEIEEYIQENFPHAKTVYQKNRYFDDANKRVEQLQNMLRIRSFKSCKEREFTYKVRGNDGDLEYTQGLSHYWFYQITRFSRLPDGPVKNKLLEDGVDVESLKMFVDLYNRRVVAELDDYTLFLDINLYNDISDYDLEIESNISKQHAKEVILQYCKMFNIEYKDDYKTKIRRVIDSLKK